MANCNVLTPIDFYQQQNCSPLIFCLLVSLCFWGCPGRALPVEDLPECQVQPYLYKHAMPLMSSSSCTCCIRQEIPGGWVFLVHLQLSGTNPICGASGFASV